MITEPPTIPLIASDNIIHLSGLDACRIRLSAQASRNNEKPVIHAITQYRLTKSLLIVIRATEEIVHNMALKIKGGSGNMNWKMFNTITNADNRGYFNTGGLSAFS